jgi:hypothetical protein
MLPDCRDICAAYPWVREVWLFASPAAPGDAPEGHDLLVVCDRSPKSVAPGQRKRLLKDIEVATGRSLDLRLTTAEQLSKWLSAAGRFAAAFRSAERLYP